jgi:integrase
MAGGAPMMRLVRSYLALRRSTGFQLRWVEYKLRSFCRFAGRRGERYVRAATAIAWARLAPSPRERRDKLATVNRFALHARLEDRRYEIASLDVFPAPSIARRPVPFIFSPDEISGLVSEALNLTPVGSLRPHTLSTLFSLLASTGLRISEALKLKLSDLTDDGLVIRETKFAKSRLVPLHATVAVGLAQYLDRRLCVATEHEYLFISLAGSRLGHQQVFKAFRQIVDQQLRLRDGRSTRRPRLHDLRHTFAVRSLESCAAEHVDRHMLALSTYLGHADVKDTYWYLQATPDLLRQIGNATQHFVRRGVQ